MSYFISLSCSICEEVSRNYVIVAHPISPAQTGAASTKFFWVTPDDFIVADFGLNQLITEVPISSIANYRFIPEFSIHSQVISMFCHFFSRISFNSGRFLLYCTISRIQLEFDGSLYVRRVALSLPVALFISRDGSNLSYPRFMRSCFRLLAWVQKSIAFMQILRNLVAWLKAMDVFVDLGW